MKNYTIEEKMILLNAMDQNIKEAEIELSAWSDDHDRMQFSESIDILKDLRVKLMLYIDPIRIHHNNCASKYPCPFCGRDDSRSGIPQWAFWGLKGNGIKPICQSCFKEYEPELFKSIWESNDKWFEDQKMGLNDEETEMLLEIFDIARDYYQKKEIPTALTEIEAIEELIKKVMYKFLSPEEYTIALNYYYKHV
jgi:hypothetical protein